MSKPRLKPLTLCLIALAGCAGGEDVTTRSIANARRIWDAAKIRDYDLEWTSSGARDGHYRIFVRDGKVRSIRAFVDDRKERRVREIEVKPGDPSYYSVDGLFKILEEERSQLSEPAPFGQPKGTSVLLRFTPDPKLGYPKRFRRDVVGTPRGLAIDVVRFTPNPGAAIPPPAK
ncbi:MAG: hypothetical protein JWN86_3913 [Planctomycetota bacterium]|nr:hypothetical protein [Planctomycetota bacterium]